MISHYAPDSSQTHINGHYANIEALFLCCLPNDIQLYTVKALPSTLAQALLNFLGTWFILYCNIRPLLLPNHVRAKTCERRCVDGTHVLVDTMPHRESCNIYI